MRRAILERCQELGLTQCQLARLVGVKHNTLSGYISGATTPSLRVALRMGQVLGEPVETLFADLARPLRGGEAAGDTRRGVRSRRGPAPRGDAGPKNDRADSSIPRPVVSVQ